MGGSKLGKLPTEEELAKREAEKKAREQAKEEKRKKKYKNYRRKLERERQPKRLVKVYAVSLNRLNQSAQNMRLVSAICKDKNSNAWQHAFTVIDDKLVVLFRRMATAEKFYINAYQRGYEPNNPIWYIANRHKIGLLKKNPKETGNVGTWKMQKPVWEKNGVLIDGKKFTESQAQRMSRVTSQRRSKCKLH